MQSLFRRDPKPDKLSTFLRVLVGPLRTRRAQNQLWNLRHEALPALRHRAQSRIYRAIVKRQARLAARTRRFGGGFIAYLLGPRRRLRGGRLGLSIWARPLARRSRAIKGPTEGSSEAARSPMAQSGLSSTWGQGSGDGTAPGGRRKKAYEWFKAANELGQAYTSRWTSQRSDTNEDYYHTPGAFPDVEIARSGDEEMVLFPSYGRRLPEKKVDDTKMRSRRDSWSETIDDYRGVSEDSSDRLSDGWPNPDLENAMADVDVRGWIYAPNRGPMNRKHRLMVKLARTLSGIPTPTGNANEDSPEPLPAKGEDEYVDKQMKTLVDTAERDADQAWKSSHTERARGGLKEAAQLTKDEISMANAHLMERLRPFLTNPVASMPVTIFFFDNDQSESRNLMTDESGHFNVRVPLPFVPTHVRVLASEDLSAARPIEIIEPSGISMISDIDDTVKHSAIASGAKEMFRNTFVRELAELQVGGVSEWYAQVAKRGVQMHYVSNAPWQLYPLLERYFKLAGLPPGSFHLKQYSGMLQGIFEPTAERKRGSLEQILRDFPDRKFVLVGDSGEADLEVYTDIVLANRGRILGIFIRDVTTTKEKSFFDKSTEHLEASPGRSRSTPQLVDHSASAPSRPALPPRRNLEKSATSEKVPKSLENEDLIDLRDDEEPKLQTSNVNTPGKPRLPPTKPSKPSTLRTTSGAADTLEPPAGISRTPSQEAVRRKPVPPLPPRRTSTARTDSLIDLDPSPPLSRTQTEPITDGARQTPSVPSRSKAPPPVPPPRRTNTASSTSTTASSTPTNTGSSRPTPAAKPSYPMAAAQATLQYATECLNLSSAAPNPGLRSTASNQSLGRTNTSTTTDSVIPAAPLPNKREELWRRRWERASEILEDHGVVLGSWRIGSDAQPVCMWLIEEQLKKAQKKGDN